MVAKTPVTSPTLLEKLEASSKKRKASPLNPNDATETGELEALVAMREALSLLVNRINQLYTSKKNAELKGAARAVVNRLSDYEVLRQRDCGPRPATVSKPETKEAGTDMTLTPEWWVSTQPIGLKSAGPKSGKREVGLKQGRAGPANTNRGVTIPTRDKSGARNYVEATSQPPTLEALDVEEGGYTVVKKKQPKTKSMKPPAADVAPKRLQPKKPAVLVKVPTGASYADTVRALRAPGAIAPADVASVSVVRKTREGHVLASSKEPRARKTWR